MMKRAFAILLAALVALVTTPAAAQRVAFVSTNGAIAHWPLFAAPTTFVTSQGTTSTTWSLGGTLGPLWNNNGGVFEARNPANSAFVVVRGATPAASNDLTTKNYVDTATAAITIPALTGVATTNGYLQWNGSSFAWTTPSGGFTAGGDLAGTGSSQTVVGLQGFALSAATPATGNGLFWNGSAWTPSAVNLAGGSPWVTGLLPVSSLGHGTTGTILITNSTTPTWTAMAGDGTIGATGSLTVTGIRSNSVPSPSGTNTVLQWSGSAFSWASPAATSVTGTGLWYSATGMLNAAAVGLSGDATIGALSGGSLPITFATVNGNVGTFGSASVVPIITVNAKGLTTAVSTATIAAPLGSATGTLASANGGSGVASPAAHTVLVGEGASPFAVVGPGTSGVPLLGGGASADPAFGALSLAGGSSVITGTLPAGNGGMGVASPTAHSVLVGEGASAVTPVAIGDAQVLFGQSAADPAPKTIGGDLSCIDTGVCTVNKISGSSPIAITPSTLQWTTGTTAPTLSQATTSGATGATMHFAPQVSTNTNGTPGNFSVDLGSPTGSGTNPFLQVTLTGMPTIGFGSLSAGQASLWLITAARSATNYALTSDGSAFTALNAPTTVYLQTASTTRGVLTNVGLTLFNGTTVANDGGTGVLSLADATTLPTSAATSGHALLYSDSHTLETNGAGFNFMRLVSNPLITQVQATTDVATQQLKIVGQAAFASATSTNKNTQQVQVLDGNPASGGTHGGVKIGTSDGVNTLEADAANGVRIVGPTTSAVVGAAGNSMTETLAHPSNASASINSQDANIVQISNFCQTTSNTGVCTATSSRAVASGKTITVYCHGMGRTTTAGGGLSLGDSVMGDTVSLIRNDSGSVTSLGSLNVHAPIGSAALTGSSNAVFNNSITTPGCSMVTISGAPGGTLDDTVWGEVVYN